MCPKSGRAIRFVTLFTPRDRGGGSRRRTTYRLWLPTMRLLPPLARPTYREAIRFKKHYAEAHRHLAWALCEKGRLDEAIAEYREAIRIKKDYAEAHYNLGNALWRKGSLDEAIDEWREAIRDALGWARGGDTVADVAAALHLSEGTVRNHLSAAIGKTGARTRAEAVKLAEDHGWLLG